MPLVPKEIIRPGTYWYIDQKTGKPAKMTVTADGTKHLCQQGNKMLGAGLSIPVPLDHQFDMKPMTDADKKASLLRHNTGWVNKYFLGGPDKDRLFSMLDIQDEEIYNKLPRTIKFVSPWINSFTDGDGRKWDGVISHVALTSRPRITRQEPFPSIAAALSLAADLVPFDAPHVTEDGYCLSKSGLLIGDGAALSPVYPIAFSMWSGLASAPLAMPEIEEKVKEKTPPKKESTPPPEMSKEKPAADKTPGGEDLDEPKPENQLGDEMPDEDGDEEMALHDILREVISALWGIELPEGLEGNSFGNELMKALMNHLKMNGPNAQQTNEPPGGKPPSTTQPPQHKPPTIQESPPMYMSLEEIQVIADPEKKRMALEIHRQREREKKREDKELAAAKAKRDERVSRIAACLPAGARDKLLQRVASPSAALSIDDDTNVIDPLDADLDIIEATLSATPTLLKGSLNPKDVYENPHPRDFNGTISEAERVSLMEELARNTNLQLN